MGKLLPNVKKLASKRLSKANKKWSKAKMQKAQAKTRSNTIQALKNARIKNKAGQ
jgi:hypothetical protein